MKTLSATISFMSRTDAIICLAGIEVMLAWSRALL